MPRPLRSSQRGIKAELHDRHAVQWQVAQFRELMKAQRTRVLALTWDDHDFAWNNALGQEAGKPQWDVKAVPGVFKEIALRERVHFRVGAAQLQRRHLPTTQRIRPRASAAP